MSPVAQASLKLVVLLLPQPFSLTVITSVSLCGLFVVVFEARTKVPLGNNNTR